MIEQSRALAIIQEQPDQFISERPVSNTLSSETVVSSSWNLDVSTMGQQSAILTTAEDTLIAEVPISIVTWSDSANK